MPFDVLSRLLPQTTAAEPLRQTLSRFETSPITGIHLWFDRQITDLDHAVLLDRTIQWMFHKSKLLGRSEDAGTDNKATSSWSSARRRLWSRNLVRRLSIWRYRNCVSFSPVRVRQIW